MGDRVAKRFDGYGLFVGSVASVPVDGGTKYVIHFDDEDIEEWTRSELNHGKALAQTVDH